jgi:ribonucleoside-diphosphate reductase alpha chain
MADQTSPPPFDIGAEIWARKYRFQGRTGVRADRTVADSWERVARAAAANEREPKRWAKTFGELLADYRFLPGGRILANAGTKRPQVTMLNCYVMNRIEDSIEGIFDTVKEAALTQKQGGGVGFDFSTIRPAGCHISGCEAESSGPLSFMQVLDATCRTIMSAGQRRGAQMGVLRCDHPNIEEFIAAKRHNAALQMFNLSVAVTDAFIAAVRADQPWDLTFGGQTYRTVSAVALWEKIMRSTYNYAEPGFLLVDRINALNNLWYAETIAATNPCVTADTWVHTAKGPRKVADLVGVKAACRVDGTDHRAPRGFFATGRKPVLALSTREGYSLRLTAEHPLRKVVRISRQAVVAEWAEAATLRQGDKILLNNHRANREWDGDGTWDEGYLIGLLLGDGTIKKDKTILSAWPRKPEADGVMAEALAATASFPHRRDFQGWQKVAGRDEYRLSCAGLAKLATRFGLRPGNKTVTDAMEQAASAFCCGLLRGLFDADGSVQGSQLKGVSIRLSQSDLGLLQAVQRLLLRLGIVATIYRHRRRAGTSLLPDGKGGRKPYPTRAQHELAIAGDNLAEFAEAVGFSDAVKAGKLRAKLAKYGRKPNRERFVAEVAEVVADGVEEVYDIQVPGVNAFDANGLLAHNCGEQPLPPYGACLLGSVNLTRFARAPFTAKASVDLDGIAATAASAVRFLDNIIDISGYPLPQQQAEAASKRRMGIGITGLADLFLFLGLRYGSPESADLAARIMATIRDAAYEASVRLGREKGTFPLFDAAKYSQGKFIQALPAGLRRDIRRHGLRNSHLTSIAPTGTISLFAGNISSGLEPVFAWHFRRKIRNGHENDVSEVEIADYAYRAFRERRKGRPDEPLPAHFVTAADISPAEHLAIQAALQPFVDSSISKTINVPTDFPYEDFKGIYLSAFDLGLKGCTTFRPSEHIAGILSTAPAPAPAAPSAVPSAATATVSAPSIHLTPRPKELDGVTYKLRTPLSSEALYLTINDVIEEDGRRRPYELFINTKNLQHFSWIVAMTRLISAVFRREPDPTFLVEELKSIYDPNGGYFANGQYVPSLVADIGLTIEQHLRRIGILPPAKERAGASGPAATVVPHASPPEDGDGDASRQLMICPQCNGKGLVVAENCLKCLLCDYSKCG